MTDETISRRIEVIMMRLRGDAEANIGDVLLLEVSSDLLY